MVGSTNYQSLCRYCYNNRLKVEELDNYKSNVSVPYNYLNKNPFKSMYFAVQSMAGELSTGCLVILHADDKNISTLVTNIEANFHKKAINTINFICLDGEKALLAIKKACDTNKAQKCIMLSKKFLNFFIETLALNPLSNIL